MSSSYQPPIYEPFESFSVGSGMVQAAKAGLTPEGTLNAALIRHEIDALMASTPLARTGSKHPLQEAFDGEVVHALQRHPVFANRIARIQHALNLVQRSLHPAALAAHAQHKQIAPETLQAELTKANRLCSIQQNAFEEMARGMVACAVIVTQYQQFKPFDEKPATPEVVAETPTAASAPTTPFQAPPAALPADIEDQIAATTRRIEWLERLVKSVVQLRTEASAKPIEIGALLPMVEQATGQGPGAALTTAAEWIAAFSPHSIKTLDKHLASFGERKQIMQAELSEMELIAGYFKPINPAAVFDVKPFLNKLEKFKPEQIRALQVQAAGFTDAFRREVDMRRMALSRMAAESDAINTVKSAAFTMIKDNTSVAQLCSLELLPSTAPTDAQLREATIRVASRGERVGRELADLLARQSRELSDLKQQQHQWQQQQAQRIKDAEQQAQLAARRAEQEKRDRELAQEAAKVISLATGRPADGSIEPVNPNVKLAESQLVMFRKNTEQLWQNIHSLIEPIIRDATIAQAINVTGDSASQ